MWSYLVVVDFIEIVAEHKVPPHTVVRCKLSFINRILFFHIFVRNIAFAVPFAFEIIIGFRFIEQ